MPKESKPSKSVSNRVQSKQSSKTNQVEESEAERDARIELLDHLGSQLRYWGSSLVALAVAFFAAVQVRQQLVSVGLFELAMAALLVQTLCSVLRMLWLGGLADRVLYAHPSDSVTGPLLFRLAKGTEDCFKSRTDGRVLNYLSSFRGYTIFFVSVTFCLWIVTLLFGNELAAMWLGLVRCLANV